MGFSLPDLVVESIIRDGLQNLRNRPELIDRIFSELGRPYADRKYGQAELQRLRDYISAKGQDIAVVHSFHEAAAKTPSISIQLGREAQPENKQYLGDGAGDLVQTLTDAQKLADLVKVSNLTPTSFDSTTGMVRVADTVNLTDVRPGFLYRDGSQTDFVIQPGISNVAGDKFFNILPGSNPNIAQAGEIRSFILTEEFEVMGTVQHANIMIGCHSKEALLAKYLYVLVKFFLKSRTPDLIARCFDNPTIEGSDFARDLKYQGDHVFVRFLTLKGRTEDTWRTDEVDLIDTVEVDPTPVDC